MPLYYTTGRVSVNHTPLQVGHGSTDATVPLGFSVYSKESAPKCTWTRRTSDRNYFQKRRHKQTGEGCQSGRLLHTVMFLLLVTNVFYVSIHTHGFDQILKCYQDSRLGFFFFFHQSLVFRPPRIDANCMQIENNVWYLSTYLQVEICCSQMNGNMPQTWLFKLVQQGSSEKHLSLCADWNPIIHSYPVKNVKENRALPYIKVTQCFFQTPAQQGEWWVGHIRTPHLKAEQ